jgi:HD-GYP domain-containing protein (c-di-GMP phosphodiesterase class II)
VALQELVRHAGTQFDPDLVHHFVQLAREHDFSLPLMEPHQNGFEAPGIACAQ